MKIDPSLHTSYGSHPSSSTIVLLKSLRGQIRFMIQGCCQNEFRDAEPILMLDDPSRMAMMSMSWEEQDYHNGIKSFL